MIYVVTKSASEDNSIFIVDHTTRDTDHERMLRRAQNCATAWGKAVRVEWGSGPRARADFHPKN